MQIHPAQRLPKFSDQMLKKIAQTPLIKPSRIDVTLCHYSCSTQSRTYYWSPFMAADLAGRYEEMMAYVLNSIANCIQS